MWFDVRRNAKEKLTMLKGLIDILSVFCIMAVVAVLAPLEWLVGLFKRGKP